ncbi:MAG TPA: fimbrial protein [Nitrosomonas nitrosa]|uniref:PilN domain-containing protein n=1 Tax=Nitrosomonas nitrosa TaxID=52442 RepID=UPI000D31BD6C|nr:PilN domain-containing protein [Nitrosomonas nitrosa]PTR04756.1 type IV pilus assembly protein PilN [Nitrosomonas nitrosa]HBZ29357.1 fimbrial protein [Nitrosomonas nitrosa]HNP51477.1 PilN domain-containing protein [Nitrosomonas nitrosa]
MIRINLLPHREIKRKAKQQQFAVLAGITCLLGAAIVWGGDEMISGKIEYQNERNRYLQGQIAILDKQIEEIKQIKQQIDEMLARKEIIETLQANRTHVVHILDQVARLMPDGVYLKSIKQTDQHIHLSGYAQSNAWVSTLMRNLDASSRFESPLLIEIKAVTVNNARLNEFDLKVRLVEPSDKQANELISSNSYN